MKNIFTVAAAAVAAVTLTAGTAWAGTINQGDRVRNQDWMTCTVGYVQPGSAYTAGHCGKTGDTMYNYNTDEQLGTLNTHYTHAGGEDWAEIQLNDTTTAGENIYSGNQIVSPENVEVGDTIHSYGGKTGKQYTGTVTDTDGEQILATGEAGGLPGDSGGPFWIDGKGLVGVYTSYYTDGTPEDKYAVGFHPISPEGAPQYNPNSEGTSESVPDTNIPEPKPETDKPETDKPETDKPETDKPENDVHYEEAPLGSTDAYIEVDDFDDTTFHGARGEVNTNDSESISDTSSDNSADTTVDTEQEDATDTSLETGEDTTVENTAPEGNQNANSQSRTLASTGVGSWVVPVTILAVVLLIAGGVVIFRNNKK